MAAGFVALAIVFLVLTQRRHPDPDWIVLHRHHGAALWLAVIFVGQGIASFQESGWMRATFIDHVPTIQVLGLFPTVQTLVAQAVMLGLATLALFAVLGRTRKHDDAPAAAGSKVSAHVA